MSARLVFRVHGTPAPQGSKRHVGNGVMVESSAKVKPWRQDVKYAALEAHGETCGGEGTHFLKGVSVFVALTFYLPRPRGHYGSGRNAAVIKPSAPQFPGVKPDLDKLVRSTLDALGEAGIWADDSQVVRIHASKVYTFDEIPAGARIEVGQA